MNPRVVLMSAVLVAGALGSTLGCRGSGPNIDAAPTPSAQAATAGYRVEGVACESCAKRLRAGLMKADGIKSVSVDVAAKHVTVDYDAATTDAQRIRAAIEALGFTATKDEKPPST